MNWPNRYAPYTTHWIPNSPAPNDWQLSRNYSRTPQAFNNYPPQWNQNYGFGWPQTMAQDQIRQSWSQPNYYPCPTPQWNQNCPPVPNQNFMYPPPPPYPRRVSPQRQYCYPPSHCQPCFTPAPRAICNIPTEQISPIRIESVSSTGNDSGIASGGSVDTTVAPIVSLPDDDDPIAQIMAAAGLSPGTEREIRVEARTVNLEQFTVQSAKQETLLSKKPASKQGKLLECRICDEWYTRQRHNIHMRSHLGQLLLGERQPHPDINSYYNDLVHKNLSRNRNPLCQLCLSFVAISKASITYHMNKKHYINQDIDICFPLWSREQKALFGLMDELRNPQRRKQTEHSIVETIQAVVESPSAASSSTHRSEFDPETLVAELDALAAKTWCPKPEPVSSPGSPRPLVIDIPEESTAPSDARAEEHFQSQQSPEDTIWSSLIRSQSLVQKSPIVISLLTPSPRKSESTRNRTAEIDRVTPAPNPGASAAPCLNCLQQEPLAANQFSGELNSDAILIDSQQSEPIEEPMDESERPQTVLEKQDHVHELPFVVSISPQNPTTYKSTLLEQHYSQHSTTASTSNSPTEHVERGDNSTTASMEDSDATEHAPPEDQTNASTYTPSGNEGALMELTTQLTEDKDSFAASVDTDASIQAESSSAAQDPTASSADNSALVEHDYSLFEHLEAAATSNSSFAELLESNETELDKSACPSGEPIHEESSFGPSGNQSETTDQPLSISPQGTDTDGQIRGECVPWEHDYSMERSPPLTNNNLFALAHSQSKPSALVPSPPKNPSVDVFLSLTSGCNPGQKSPNLFELLDTAITGQAAYSKTNDSSKSVSQDMQISGRECSSPELAPCQPSSYLIINKDTVAQNLEPNRGASGVIRRPKSLHFGTHLERRTVSADEIEQCLAELAAPTERRLHFIMRLMKFPKRFSLKRCPKKKKCD